MESFFTNIPLNESIDLAVYYVTTCNHDLKLNEVHLKKLILPQLIFYIFCGEARKYTHHKPGSINNYKYIKLSRYTKNIPKQQGPPRGRPGPGARPLMAHPSAEGAGKCFGPRPPMHR